MNKIKGIEFLCPACKTYYVQGYTKAGTPFIAHLANFCKNSNSAYIGKNLQTLIAKGGEEDVEIVKIKKRGET